MTSQLYAGHRGAGKSTELLRLQQYLDEQGCFVVYFPADEQDIDPEDAQYTDILLACTGHLLEKLKDSTDPASLLNWLSDRYNLGRYEEALISLDKALEFTVNDDLSDIFYVWRWRGNTLNTLDRYEEAIASFDKALSIQPDYHIAWNVRGIMLKNLGRYEEAIASFDKALEFKPDYDSAWYNKACSYGLQRNIEQALKNLQQAINLNPDKYREMAKTDSDFDRIRDAQRFQALIQG
jgi:tetratricopeptide (TPR) repeat protein